MKRKLFRPRTSDYVLAVILTGLAILILYPFYNAVLTSIVTEVEYIRTPFLLFPKKIDLTSYRYIIEDGRIFMGMSVTTFVTVAGAAYNMFLTIICSYVLTKPFPGRKILSYMIIFTIYFSGGLIPYYLLMKNLQLMDSVLAMILPMGINFMYMTVIRRHFEEIPRSLLEAAKIDGAGDLRILTIIIVPLSMPILATFLLYYGVNRWNEWWNGMLFIKSVAKQPLQLVLRTIVQDATSANSDAGDAAGMVIFGNGIKMASTMVSMLPIMILYPFLQRFFIGGLTVGAVKE